MKEQFVSGRPYFTDINNVSKQYKYLTEDIEAEVVIVGGGVTGAILGYYFARNNIKTVILEKERVAFGSTSITTALLQYELDSTAMELAKVIPLENVIRAYKLGQKALDEVEKFSKEYGNNFRYKKRDCLLYTDKESEVEELHKEYQIRKANGLEVDFITEKNNPFSFDLKAGVYSNDGGAEIDPYLFAHELISASKELGLKIYENTEVLKINHYSDYVEIITNYENIVKCKKVIIATGYNTERFTERTFGKTTTTYNIVTKPLKEIIGWKNSVLIRDNNDPYHYYRTTDDNRIIAGGEDITSVEGENIEEESNKKYNLLENRIKSMFPQIKDLGVQYKYCGTFKSTKDNLGFIGIDDNYENQWYTLGYGANGILFAILGGMMLPRLYMGEKDQDLELFNFNRK